MKCPKTLEEAKEYIKQFDSCYISQPEELVARINIRRHLATEDEPYVDICTIGMTDDFDDYNIFIKSAYFEIGENDILEDELLMKYKDLEKSYLAFKELIDNRYNS